MLASTETMPYVLNFNSDSSISRPMRPIWCLGIPKINGLHLSVYLARKQDCVLKIRETGVPRRDLDSVTSSSAMMQPKQNELQHKFNLVSILL